MEHMPGMRALAARRGELPRREQEILLLRFHGDMTQAQTGQQLRISRMHVSRLLTRALGYLRPACPACRSAHPAPVSPGHPAWL